MKKMLIVAALLAVAGVAQAQDQETRSPGFRALAIAHFGEVAVDVSQSMYGFGSGRYYEGNPVMRPMQDHPEAFAVVAFGSAVAWNAWTAHLHRKHPRLATWLRVGMVVAEGAVVINNARKTRGR